MMRLQCNPVNKGQTQKPAEQPFKIAPEGIPHLLHGAITGFRKDLDKQG